MKNLWVAYSGGVDSHVLLHLAVQAGYQPRAVHINDGLSPNADKWQKHCEQICRDLKIELVCKKVSIKANKTSKQSARSSTKNTQKYSNLEEAARNARRAAWLEVLSPGDILMLAQHADDQAETILYRLLRGAGPQGLAAMNVESKLENITLYRPFLEIDKQAILAYAKKHKLNYIEDETNRNINFDRNYIRHKIMPLLQKRWPSGVTNINRAGRLSSDLCSLLEPYIRDKLSACLSENQCELNLQQLAQFSPSWQREILRAWLQMHDLKPSVQHIDFINAEVISAKIDAQPRLQISDKIIRRFQGKLYVIRAEQEKFSAQAHGKRAKNIFQQHGVPSWERGNYQLSFENGKLMVIEGLWKRKE